MPRVRFSVGAPRTPGTRAMLWCMVSTRLVTPRVASIARRLVPRRSDRRTWAVRDIGAEYSGMLREARSRRAIGDLSNFSFRAHYVGQGPPNIPVAAHLIDLPTVYVDM